MKTLQNLIWLAIFALTSCVDSKESLPKTSFDSPFPKRNRDLSNILGDHLAIKQGTDTLSMTITAFKNYNLITNDQNGDTLFKGLVSMYRGLYYFSQQLNDTSFWIYAVKLKDNLVYGLNTAWEQTLFVDRAIENGKHQKLVRHITADKIRLHPEKKELKYLFASIVDSLVPDTIIQFQKTIPAFTDTTKVITQIDPDDFEFFSKVYPNPTTDFVNIELHQKSKIFYQLTDISRKTVLHGQFENLTNKINLSKLSIGIYYLALINPNNNQKETIKIIKIK